MILSSKSSPPSLLLPFVARTSKTPSLISSMDTSKVPPPRSNTMIFWSCSLSIPYASAAAVGSLIILSTSIPAIFPASLVACLCESLKYAGTVMTAWVIVSPRYASASAFSFCRIIAEISWGVYPLPSMSTRLFVPMSLLIERMVLSGFVIACLFATWPTILSPVFENATADGVVLPPSAFAITTASPPSMTATHEFVVPRSIPIILAIFISSYGCYLFMIQFATLTRLCLITLSL